MGQTMEIRPVNFFASIPDRTAEAYKILPSINLNIDDHRIDDISKNTTEAFLVYVTEKSETYVVIVNPNKKSGFLWWKKSKKLVMLNTRFDAIKNKTETPTEKENEFFDGLEVKLRDKY